MILISLYVAHSTSVTLAGEYVNLQWVPKGPTHFTFRVGGVVVYKPNDYTIGINATNSFSNTNVYCLMMDYNNMKYLPGSYTRLFYTIGYLIVRNAHVKYITNADFSGLKNLRHVDFKNNEIEHLPGNLFQGVSKTITTVLLMNNKIINVGPNFIANMPKLVYLHLIGNPCISFNSPVTFNLFTTTFRTKCQKPIIPDVITHPPATYEDLKALNTKSVDLINENENLTAELKLRNDRIKDLEQIIKLKLDLGTCKLTYSELQNDLLVAENRIQTMKLKDIINKQKTRT